MEGPFSRKIIHDFDDSPFEIILVMNDDVHETEDCMYHILQLVLRKPCMVYLYCSCK